MSDADLNKERLELALEAAGLDLWENNLLTGEVTRKASKTFEELGFTEEEIVADVQGIYGLFQKPWNDRELLKRVETLGLSDASVQALSSQMMDRAGVRDFDDLTKLAPTLTISKTTQPGNNSINVRGVGTYSYSIGAEPSVVVVIDDVPQAFQAMAFTALADVRQVEILRGPQSTLFGKSASAGVIYITTNPASDVFAARAETIVNPADPSLRNSGP